MIHAYFAHVQKGVEGERVEVLLTHRFSYLVPGIGPVQESDIVDGGVGLPAPPAPETVLPKPSSRYLQSWQRARFLSGPRTDAKRHATRLPLISMA